jgi:hypothetical protein
MFLAQQKKLFSPEETVDITVAALSSKNNDLTSAFFMIPGERSPFGSSPPAITTCAQDYWFKVGKHVWKKLHAHAVFVRLILPSSLYDSTSLFDLLNQGNPAEGAAFKRIAEFVGLPTGAELGRLRGARKALALYGVHWPDPKC